MASLVRLSAYAGFSGTDETLIDAVEADLFHRLDSLRNEDDHIVVLGMAAAGLLSPAVAQHAVDDSAARRSPVDLNAHGIPTEGFTRFQRLWYHFKVPYARASLVWWYVFCLALGSGDGRVDQALERMTRWLDFLGGDLDAVLPRIGAELGLSSSTLVVTSTETTDVRALATAVRMRAPLIAVDDVAAAEEVGQRGDVQVLAVGQDSGNPTARAQGALWLGHPHRLHRLPQRARQAWRELPEDERDELLAGLERRVTSIERIRFRLDEDVLDNRGVASVVTRCRKDTVTDWPEPDLVLATVLWCWHEAGYALQELNQALLSLPGLTLFLTRRAREYSAKLPPAERGRAALTEASPITLARELRRLRSAVETEWERCLHFDGSNWERREFLLPRAVYRRPQVIPEDLYDHLHARIGVALPNLSGRLEDWDRYVELALEDGSNPTRIMQEIAHWAANAPDLDVDLAIFTVPLGSKLDEPWTMDFKDLFCYTAFKDGFQPAVHGLAADRVAMYNIIAQRMRYNAVKKAQNYAPVMRFAPQGFNLPDIAIAEDANHGGHAAAGIRLACRLPIAIVHREQEWNGLADVRLNRAVYHRDNRFRPRDMVLAHRYTQWAKGIAEATYRRGLRFQEKWSEKVKDLDI